MKLHLNHRPLDRRGLAAAEWFCILGFLAAGVVMWSYSAGPTTSQGIGTTAVGVGDPSQLVKNPLFKAPSQSSTQNGSPSRGTSQDPTQSSAPSRTRGNNGVGNGLDPQPPGNPPVNDGPGTGPGNPGNRGGAHR
jgi:hypothetical protein